MSSDKTQFQSTEDLQQSQDLSLSQRKPPAEIEGYTIQELVGSGAYGEVWTGLDRTTGRKVAIKFYTRKHSLDFSMLSREVEKLVFLAADRYVVQLLDVGWHSDPPYYVMDYISNGSLEDELKRREKLPVDEAVELFEEIAIGLMHLHGRGILHCDLKPGNVLLDQDYKPRLADFGQSRLSHEQAPALGTLFFMAPEQADLKAVPDTRWDVYALGALLYCMLTGSPPYRGEDLTAKIESTEHLESRLEQYKTLIQDSPKPHGHRSVPGVDRPLADIVSRCIDANPKQRFPSIQSVLVALRQRQTALARRPLMVLGILGPLLLLAMMFGFASLAYNDAITKSDTEFTRKAIDRNKWAAKFAAGTVSERIDDYFQTVHSKLQANEFQERLASCLNDHELDQMSLRLSDPADNENEALAEVRNRFIQNPVRRRLNVLLDQWLADPQALQAASWFVCDKYGTQIAAAFSSQSNNTIGMNWGYRSYYHSAAQDVVQWDSAGQPQYGVTGGIKTEHITSEKISSVFMSKASFTWKVAFSAPIMIDEQFRGIIGVTVEMGEFISFPDGPDQFAMLVNGLPGENQGIVLEHPLIRAAKKQLDPHEKLPEKFSNRRLNVTELEQGHHLLIDPLGYNPRQRPKQRWIVDYVPVTRSPKNSPELDEPVETGLLVVTAEDAQSVLEPSRELGRRLLRVGIMALIAFLLVTGGLAVLVFRSLGQSRLAITRVHTGNNDSSSIHEAATIGGGKISGSTDDPASRIDI